MSHELRQRASRLAFATALAIATAAASALPVKPAWAAK